MGRRTRNVTTPGNRGLAMDEFTRAYLEAALWVNDPTPGSGEEYQADLSIVPDEYAREAEADCLRFQADNAADLARAGDDAQNGHDFYLTRNGHGAGYWDRGYGDVGDRLSKAARAYGETDGDWVLFADDEDAGRGE